MAKVPFLRLDRPAIAFIGAVAMVLFGVMTFPEAIGLIDWDTIALLLGMMVLIGALQQDGYTQALATALFRKARTGKQLLVVIVAFSAIASAFLVNDAVVLVLTPLVVAVCRDRGINPVPYLLATAMASNVGGTATITGNPQNVLIGIRSGITFGKFLLALFPVALAAGLVLILLVRMLYAKDLAIVPSLRSSVTAGDQQAASRLRLSIVILASVVVGFIISPLIGVGLPLIALTGAGLALLASRSWPAEIYRHVNWLLLVFFAGLFVVIFAAVEAGLFDAAVERIRLEDGLPGIALLHGASLVGSQVVSNVPFTMLMLPVLEARPSDPFWLSLAAGATLAGNLTLMGSVANLIVAETAAGLGVRIGFWQFLRLGLPVTVITTLISVLVLWAEDTLGLLT